MIFDELSYFVLFLVPSVALFHVVGPVWRPWVLASSGMLFFIYYGYLHFGGTVGSACVGIFVWELVISRFYRRGSWVCVFGIVQAIGILIAFKYLHFFERVWVDVFPSHRLIVTWPPFLPLGISFFTFEFIHFAADSRSGRIFNSKVGEYAAFIFFFPSMVAGPIKRFQDFQRELRTARFSGTLCSQGTTRILSGLAKKHVLADTFALWAAQLQTADLATTSRFTLIGWLLAYGMRIYLDFSGYSDIAIGSGLLYGIVLPENFRWPYCGTSIIDFWRRWHISLSSWVRDYVYIPLGGSKKGGVRTDINLLIAFCLSGLWHGAAYNFAIWGLWHGAMTVLQHSWQKWAGPRGVQLPVPIARLLTLGGVLVGWAFFCMGAPRALDVLGRIARGHA